MDRHRDPSRVDWEQLSLRSVVRTGLPFRCGDFCRRTISITWPPQTADHFNERNSAAHVHRVVRGLLMTTVRSSPLTTSLPDRHCEGGQSRISSRHVRRRIVLNRARAQQRGARARNRLPGVGLSSSAESTAHQSNRDFSCDQ
ncbi:hypothetical protein C2E31_08275 [Rhodopirellula baltica]|nr:hypothetical protein C2E31_08275 [Rhodopirellula baltica]